MNSTDIADGIVSYKDSGYGFDRKLVADTSLNSFVTLLNIDYETHNHMSVHLSWENAVKLANQILAADEARNFH